MAVKLTQLIPSRIVCATFPTSTLYHTAPQLSPGFSGGRLASEQKFLESRALDMREAAAACLRDLNLFHTM
jgi:hypothetical protein